MRLIIIQAKKYSSLTLLLCFIFFITSCSSDDNFSPINIEEEAAEFEIPPEDKLPLFSINTNGSTIVDEPKIDAEITINQADIASFTGKIGIEIRGAMFGPTILLAVVIVMKLDT